MGYTGEYALWMGLLPTSFADSAELLDNEIWTASQEVSVPARWPATLAWVYRVSGIAAPGDSLSVTIEGPSSAITHVLALDAVTWTHRWVDVGSFAGQQVTVTFVLDRPSTESPLYVWLDDVSEGVVLFRVYLPAIAAE
jgi:hypothetical protein